MLDCALFPNRSTGARFCEMSSQFEYEKPPPLKENLGKIASEYQLGPAHLNEQLASGEVIEDRRLADLLKIIKSGGLRSGSPG